MPMELDASLPRQVIPVSWLIGTWVGVGVLGYPDVPESNFAQEVVFASHGDAFLHYSSRAWLLDTDGTRHPDTVWAESGFWRVIVPEDAEAAEAAAKERPGVDLEVVLANPSGISEVYLGRSSGGRIDLHTDVVARTATAPEYNAAQRMYGFVEGDLLWVLDIAARGHDMQSHMSARLKRVGDAPDLSDLALDPNALAENPFRAAPRAAETDPATGTTEPSDSDA